MSGLGTRYKCLTQAHYILFFGEKSDYQLHYQLFKTKTNKKRKIKRRY